MRQDDTTQTHTESQIPDLARHSKVLSQSGFVRSKFPSHLSLPFHHPQKHQAAPETRKKATKKIEPKMLSIPSTTSSTTPPIHILYTIHDSETNTQTQRRYSAFHSLHALLTQLYPAAIVPPMPGKTGMWKKGEEKEEDFTEKRRRGLQRFLRRCSVNNILRVSDRLTTRYRKTGCGVR